MRWLVPAPDGAAYERDFPDVFVETIEALTLTDTAYALGWIMAYGVFARARFTHNINILARSKSRSIIKAIFVELGYLLTRDEPEHISFLDRRSGVSVRVEFDNTELVGLAIANSASVRIFGVTTRVIESEYLLWMLGSGPSGGSAERSFGDRNTRPNRRWS
jgi:hypothetical protein